MMQALGRGLCAVGFSWPVVTVLGLTVVSSGCGDDGFFRDDVSFPEVRAAVERAPTRIDFEVEPDGDLLFVRSLDLRGRDDTRDNEALESRLAEIDAEAGDTCQGTLTLEVRGPRVAFGPETVFEDRDDRIECEQFVSRLEDLLEQESRPRIEAIRRPPRQLQAPDDAVFQADVLEIENRDTLQAISEMELNVGSDNFAECADVEATPADCLGVFNVLSTGLLVTEDTNIGGEEPEDQFQIRIQGLVEGVDLERDLVALRDGTIIAIVPETEFDNDEALQSLEEVQQALDDDRFVTVDGEGVATDTDPLRVLASEVEFTVADDDDGFDEVPTVDFEDEIVDAEVDNRALITTNGTRIRITDRTTFLPNGNLQDFDAIVDALEEGQFVHVSGTAILQRAGERAVVEAIRLRAFARELPGDDA